MLMYFWGLVLIFGVYVDKNDDTYEHDSALDPENNQGLDKKETSKQNEACSKTWLDTISSCNGTLLAASLANIMTEGLTPDQQNILGNFVSAVGSLISYKASKQDVE